MRKFKRLVLVLIMSVLACACMFGATACDNILSRGDRESSSSESVESSSVCAPHNWKQTVIKEATCTQSGTMEVRCVDCGESDNQVIPKLGHDFVTIPAKAATCTEDGYYEYKKCGRCDAVEYTKPGVTTAAKNKIAKLGHKHPKIQVWNETTKKIETVNKKATCQDSVRCERCDYTIAAKLNHPLNVAVKAEKAATCTEEGWNRYSYCLDCTYTTRVTVLPLKHDGERTGQNGDKFVALDSKAQTCTTLAYCGVCNTEYAFKGKEPAHTQKTAANCEKGAVCSVCKEEYGNPLGHVMNYYAAQEPTCTLDGWHKYEACTRAGCEQAVKAKEEAYLKALGHNETLISAIEPTCVDVGYTKGSKCNRCHLVFDEPQLRPALGHDGQREGQYGENYISGNSYAADCTTRAFCGICKEFYGDNKPTGHHTLERVEAKEPTCMSDGWYEYVQCKKCNYSTYDDNYRAKVAHAYRVYEAKAPTCLEEGNKGVTYCVFCEEDMYQASIIPALGHDVDCTRNSNSRPKTCTEKAYCGDCEKEYGTKPIGHHTAQRPATCTEKSVCEVCGEEFGDYGHLVRPDGSCYHCGEYVKKKED